MKASGAARMSLTGGGLQVAGWVQTTTYRQAGVRTPWSTPPLDARPSLAPSATALASAEVERIHESEPSDRVRGESGGAPMATSVVPTPPLGSPRRLRIPSIGVDSPVVDLGVGGRGEWELPDREVGWYRQTALPGGAGNAVLVGHLDDSWGLPRVFAHLKNVRLGDTIEVESAPAALATGSPAPPRPLRYVVSETRLVPFTAVEVMDPTADSRLTLFTCGGAWDFLHGQYSHRQIVVARPLNAAGS